MTTPINVARNWDIPRKSRIDLKNELMQWEVSHIHKGGPVPRITNIITQKYALSQNKRDREEQVSYKDHSICNCLMRGNADPLCIMIIDRLGLTSMEDIKEEKP